jgi:hypothetical protein
MMYFVVKSGENGVNGARGATVDLLETQGVVLAVRRTAAPHQIGPILVEAQEILRLDVRDGPVVVAAQKTGQIGGHLVAYDRNGDRCVQLHPIH